MARWVSVAAVIALGIAVSAATIGVTRAGATAPTAEAIEPGTFLTYTDAAGTQLSYHHFEGGDSGVLFFFDGDGTQNFQAVDEPNGKVAQVREAAAAHGFDAVFFDHPDDMPSWWNRPNTEPLARAVQEFASQLDPARLQLASYSGGAEFTARFLVRLGPVAELTVPTAALMLGGGGIAPFPAPDPLTVGDVRMHWVVGSEDSYGAVPIDGWSALESATRAEQSYRDAGFTDTELTVLPGIDHFGYDTKALLESELAQLAQRAPQAPEADPASQSAPKDGAGEGQAPPESGGALAPPVWLAAGLLVVMVGGVALWFRSKGRRG